jgi:hypothetical protein
VKLKVADEYRLPAAVRYLSRQIRNYATVTAAYCMVVSVAYVMGCQALSGIAKDLTKMSAKSAVYRSFLASVLAARRSDGGVLGRREGR